MIPEKYSLLTVFKATHLPCLLLRPDAPQFTILNANAAYLELTGRTESELIGKTIFTCFPRSPEDTATNTFTELRRSLNAVINSGESTTLSSQLLHVFPGNAEEKKTISCEVQNIPIPGDEQTVSLIWHTIKTSADRITQLKNPSSSDPALLSMAYLLQKAKKDLYKIMDSSMDVICAVDSNGYFLEVSAASETVWGYTPGEMIGKRLIDFVYKEDIEKTLAVSTRVMAGQNSMNFENRYVHKNGTIVPLEWSARYDSTDKIRYGVARDATVKNKLQRDIELERLRFHDLFLQAPSCMGILQGAAHLFEIANPPFLQLLGKINVVGKPVSEVMPELIAEGIIKRFDNLYISGDTFSVREMPFHRTGESTNGFTEMYLNLVCQARRNNEGFVDGILFFILDVSEQVASRKIIEEKEKKYRQILETAQEGIWVIDKDDCTSFVNKKMCVITGYTAEELIGQKIYKLMPESTREISLSKIEKRKLGKREVYDSVLLNKKGQNIIVNISTNPTLDDQGNYSGTFAMITDITKRKRTEQEMTWLMDNTEECFILLNPDLRIVSYNKQFQILYAHYFGIQVRKGDYILDYVHPDRREAVDNTYQRVLSGMEEIAEVNIVKPGNSEPDTFLVKYKPATSKKNEIIGSFVSIVNITERRKAEHQLIMNEKRFRALIENGGDAILILSPNGKPIYISTALQRVLGYSPDEAMYLNLFSLTHPEDRVKIDSIWETVLANKGTPVAAPASRVLHIDGSWRWVEAVFTNMLHDPSVNGIIDNFRDVTEKIIAEQQKEFEKRDKEALINTTEDLMWSVTTDFKLIAANHAFTSGLKNNAGIDLKPGDVLMMEGKYPAEYLDLWQGLYNIALQGRSFIKEIYTPAWGIFPESWAETRFNPIYDGDTITGIACYTRDTTASRAFKNELLEINKKLETAQESAQLGYWESDMDQDTLYWSNQVYKIWGVSPETHQPNYKYFYESIHPDDRDLFDVNRRPAFEGKSKLDVEHRIILPDGSIKHVHEKGELVYSAEGKLLHFEGTVQDITERRIAEDKIKESELRYRSLIEQATDAICIADPDLRFIDMNPFACKLLGYTLEEAVKLYLTDILFMDDLQKNPLRIDEAKSGKTIKNERKFKKKDGSAILMEVSTKMLEDGQYILFGHDITDRKKAELEIKESNQRFEYVTRATSDAIWDWDLLSKTIYWGETFQNIFGYNPHEISKDISSWTDYIHRDDVDRVLKTINTFIKGTGTNWEDQYRYRRKDQTYAYVIDKRFAIRDENGKALRIVGAMQDITRRKNDEFALQQSEGRLKGIIASQTNYIIRTDLDGNYTYYNQKFLDDFGGIYKSSNLIGMSAKLSVMEYHQHVVSDAFEKCLSNLNCVYQVEIDKPAGNGKLKTTLWDFICLTDTDGQPTEIQCVGIDISERKKAEKLLVDTLKEKNTILESIGDAFFAVDNDWMVTYWNSMAEKMLGRHKNEMLGNYLWDIFSSGVDLATSGIFQEALDTKKIMHFENYSTRDSKWYSISVYPSDNGLSAYFKDITERKKSEINLKLLNENIVQHAKKLGESNAELEQFAYVASHDLQEPLRMVTSYLTLIEKKYGDIIDDKGKKYIYFAVDGARRMRQIILDLLEYSRVGRNENNAEDINLNLLIDEIRILFSKQISEKKATLTVDKLPVLHTFRSPTRQVFQNLIGNALKYTRESVAVKIRVSVTELKTAWQFAVADNGIGIHEEYFDKIFVIFQRLHNKDEFSGTGMGLAVTKKIIENMGGRIWVESIEDKGSTFFFTIPKRLSL